MGDPAKELFVTLQRLDVDGDLCSQVARCKYAGATRCNILRDLAPVQESPGEHSHLGFAE
jgi:hypothetical protein